MAASLGVAITFRRRKREGFAWIAWASLMVFPMDAVFVGVFQNDPFIHKYIGFYFLVPVSIMAGIALNQIMLAIDEGLESRFRGAGACLGVTLAIVGILAGQAQTKALRGRFCILDLQKSEPEALIPAVGEAIRQHFPSKTRVLCNFMPYYGPQLEYYAKREIVGNLEAAQYWKPFLQPTKGEIGGIVWMGAEDANEILSHLPPGKKEFVRLENETFCVWKPATSTTGRLVGGLSDRAQSLTPL